MDARQIDIFGGEHVVVPHQSHSATSRDAADSVRVALPRLQERVLATLIANGPLTDEGIAELSGLGPSTARPRRIELVRAGLVRQIGTARTNSGRKAAVWAASGAIQ